MTSEELHEIMRNFSYPKDYSRLGLSSFAQEYVSLDQLEAERERSEKLIAALKMILMMPEKAMSVADLARRALECHEATQKK